MRTMKTGMYTIYDSKANAYSQPFHAVNDAVAMRMLAASVNDPGTIINQHPEDFVLYEIARFDDENAQIEIINQKAVTTAIVLKEFKQNGEN